jgi:putative flavoprotein involved in K+ transport
MWGDLSAYGFQRPPLGLKATVEQRGRIPTLADELIDVVRVGRVEVVGAVKAVESDGVILADGASVAPQVIIAATGFGSDLDGLVGHLGVLDGHGNPRGGFASHVGDGMFAIGYGIPPNGPLRAIRLSATPLARQVAAYLKRIGPSVRAPLGCAPAGLLPPGQQFRTFDDGVSLAMHAEMSRAKSKGTQ